MVEQGAEHAISAGSIVLRLAAVVVLVLLNGFFVAAEFALVGVRRSKIDQMAAEGDAGAELVQTALTNLDRYISATQLGITLASLALGWIGEPALAVLIDRVLGAMGVPIPTGAAHSVAAIAVAFTIITFLHIVFGELAPKSMALSLPERVSKLVARPLMAFAWIASPGIWLLNGAANRILRRFGIEPAGEEGHVHSPEELRLLVMQARAHGGGGPRHREYRGGCLGDAAPRALLAVSRVRGEPRQRHRRVPGQGLLAARRG